MVEFGLVEFVLIELRFLRVRVRTMDGQEKKNIYIYIYKNGVGYRVAAQLKTKVDPPATKIKLKRLFYLCINSCHEQSSRSETFALDQN